MELLHDFAFVVNGRKRKEVIRLLSFPRTPTELAKLLKVSGNVVTRIIRDLLGRGLVVERSLPSKGKAFMLTKRGNLALRILEGLVEPHSSLELARMLKAHRTIITSILAQMTKIGFVTVFKSLRPAKKVYELTERGDAVGKSL